MKTYDEELINMKELGERLKVHRTTIHRWKTQGMPRVRLTKGTDRFRLSEVIEWCERKSEEEKNEEESVSNG